MLEFSLAFGLLWAILSGVFVYGYAMYIYNGLAAAVRDAATLACRLDFDASDAGSGFRRRVQNMVVHGDPEGSGAPLVPGLTPSQVEVTWIADGAGVPATVTVRVRSFQVNAIWKTFTFDGKPSVTVPYAGAVKF